MLLVPTFNGLNVARFDAEPPFDMDPPDDFEPPEDHEGEFRDGENEFEVPQGAAGSACPATKEEVHLGERATFTAETLPLQGSQSGEVTLEAPPNAVAVALVLRFDGWRGTLEVGPVTANGRETTEDYSYGGGPLSPTAMEGERVEALGSERGVWTAEWEASTMTGSGSIGLAYQTVECVPSDGDEDSDDASGNETLEVS